MPALSSENWSDFSVTRAVKSWTKTKSWTVIDAATEEEAYAATPMAGTLKIPAEGQYLGDGSAYGVVNLTARNDGGPTTWLVTASLSTDFLGADSSNGQPLLQPASITVQKGMISIAREYDVNGNAITNSSKQPFNNVPPLTIPYIDVFVERNEPSYDLQYYSTFADGVNGNDITFAGLSVPKRCLLCHMPEMVSEYLIEPVPVIQYVRVRYCFSICISKRLQNPWDFVVADVGSKGWYTDADGNKATAGFMSKGPGLQQLSEVRLDGTGIPLAASGDATHAGITVGGQVPVASGWTPGTGVTKEQKGDLWQLTYQMRDAVTMPTF